MGIWAFVVLTSSYLDRYAAPVPSITELYLLFSPVMLPRSVYPCP